MSTVKPKNNWKLESGWLCLDFANTAEWHASNHPTESLTSHAALIGWARPIGFLPDRTAQQLLRAADQHPAEAARVLDRAVALREAIYHIFAAVAQGQTPSTANQSILNVEPPDRCPSRTSSGMKPRSTGSAKERTVIWINCYGGSCVWPASADQ